jgi:two-component system, NarL family, invasion response regulator UvrY
MTTAGSSAAVRILLVDDHAIVRAGYRHLLERHGGYRIIAEADDAQSAYLQYSAHRPDLMITDIAMPGASGLEALRRVLQLDPAGRVLIFSMHVSPDLALAALRSGARGYVTKSSTPDTLLRAIDDAMAGRQTLSPDIAQALALARVADGRSELQQLTPREFDILTMLVAPHSVDDIARALHLSPKTVQNLHYQIKRKLNVTSDIELTRFALAHGVGAAAAQAPGAVQK